MEFHLPVTQQARYFTSGPLSDEVEEVWIVLHGYGQLAEFFLKKFQPLFDPKRLFIAPEATHRYYLSGYTGRVGASWMTREDRDTDIANYITFLTSLRTHLEGELGEVRWNVMGFSQGAATAVRWVTASEFSAERLVLWAGSFPPDIDLDRGRERFEEMELQVVVGENDEFFDEGRVQSARQWLDDRNISYAFSRFEGKHDIPKAALLRLYSQWTSR